LASLETLVNVISKKDKNSAVLKYLLTCEGPTYACRRYWDWVEPYLFDRLTSSNTMTGDMEKFMAINQQITELKQGKPDLFKPLTDQNSLNLI
jgi:hypothetical protein